NVLPVVSTEGLASRVCITGGNDERPAIEPRAEPMGNAAGCEHRGPFVNPVAVGRHTDRSSSEILHLPAMIGRPQRGVDPQSDRVLWSRMGPFRSALGTRRGFPFRQEVEHPNGGVDGGEPAEQSRVYRTRTRAAFLISCGVRPIGVCESAREAAILPSLVMSLRHDRLELLDRYLRIATISRQV